MKMKPLRSLALTITIALSSLLIAALLLLSSPTSSLLCSLTSKTPTTTTIAVATSPAALSSAALLHYATSPITPQQSKAEISVSLAVLLRRSPCNFLVFGLGHDSLLWHSFNPLGTTLFLEEDPKWVQTVVKNSPLPLSAHTVKYTTHLVQANDLLRTWRSEPACTSTTTPLKSKSSCRLALSNLPDSVYKTEWDVIMIDAPRGYFDAAPGRMGAIYSAAVMARNRKGPGHTDVFLHDVDRRVEKAFAIEFLCKKYLVQGVGRLWHFKIPPASSSSSSSSNQTTSSTLTSFC